MSKSRPLTDRQIEVLNAIHELSSVERGPSLKEIGERTGLASTWAVRRYLDIFEKRGLISRTPKAPRGVRPVASVSSMAA
jgi:SOS-response transcriptional repressor LexA